jgi:serine/threonine-protein kinase
VDGRPLGTTPLKPLTLSAGQHTVRLIHPDFGTVDRMVRIEEGQTQQLAVDLKDETGLVQVLVTPWAEVMVDGRSLGTTPLKPIALKPGEHSLRFTHPGFPPVERRVQVRRAETVKIEVDMAGQR